MDFEKELNISYIDETLPKPDKSLIFEHCFYSVLLYFFVYVFLCLNPFFSKYFVAEIRIFYGLAFICYIIIAPIVFLIFKPKSIYNSHSIEIFNYTKRLLKLLFCKNTFIKKDYKSVLNSFIPSYKEKQSLMLMFIKIFFGTLMVNFLYNGLINISINIDIINNLFHFVYIDFNVKNLSDAIISNANFLYNFTVTVLFTIDIGIFAFGYLTEMTILKNKIRTVETNIFGIIVCLMCYPPFNMVSHSFIGSNHYNEVPPEMTPVNIIIWGFRLLALFFLLIYVLASVALGTKASNLTNRGTVSRFPYNIIRHPAYISKNLFWLLAYVIPVLITDFLLQKYDLSHYILHFILVLFSSLFLFFIYYMRALTEEAHLMKDPEYQEYVKKVRYRFIPFVI